MQIMTTNIRSASGNNTIRLDGITALCGPVGAGKSSILTAATASLMGLPVPGVSKPSKIDLSEIITAGKQESSAVLSSANGQARTTWPSGTVQRTGTVPSASAAACGLLNIMAMKPSDRADALSAALKAELTEHDVKSALDESGIGQVIRSAVLADFVSLGCDGCLEAWQSNGRRAKANWEAIAGPGKKYGSKVASEWRPDDWDSDLSGANRSVLERAVIDAENKLAETQRQHGASEYKLAELTEKISKIQGAKHELERAGAALERASRKSIDAARALREILRPSPEAGSHPCPHCGTALIGTGPYTFAKIADPAVMAAFEAAKKNADAADDEARRATLDEVECRRVFKELESAKRELNRILEQKRQGSDDVISIEAASDACAIAKSRLNAFDQKHRADIEHQKVLDAAAIVKMLAPDGLRKRKMVETVESFNSRMAYLCENADQGVVQLTDDLILTYCGRKYDSLSTGEAFLARTTLQIAIAQLDGSQALIVDIDRPLDAWATNSVIQMLDTVVHEEGSPFAFALLAITLSKPKSAPDLTRLGSDCVTYWVQDGVISELKSATISLVAA